MTSPLPSKLADKIELWPLDQLVPYGGNPREHSADQVRRIAASISQFGFLNPILVDRETRVVVAGHGRLEAARLLGLPRVPVVALEHLTAAQRRAYLIADNRLAEASTWNEAKLRQELEAISLELPELPELGFEAGKLRRLLAPTRAAPEDLDRSPDAGEIQVPTARLGDVWILGDHRLACGDSKDAAVRSRALGAKAADCVVTDPPYAIFGSSTGVGSDVADDRMVADFFLAVLRSIAGSLRIAGHAYVFCDWRSYPSWFAATRGAAVGLNVANLVVWNKRAGLGTNWQNVHELIVFLHRLDAKRSVWSKGSRGIRPVAKPNVLQINRAGVGGFEGAESTTVETVTEHNAAKPVDLLVELIAASTDPGELVLDLFSGSGSTLLACELARRRGAAVEIEPRWVDVAIRRWERLTGKTAGLEGHGGTFEELAAERALEAAAPSKRRRRASRSSSS